MPQTIRIALAGNPNSGKTTVFNNLTGSRQRVGNWPGVTVEKKEGKFFCDELEVRVVDLPGTYGLTAYSLDERIAREFLLHETPDLVVAVIDSSNLERNLYLVVQLLELGLNVVLDLNMMDRVKSRGVSIDTETLSNILGIPVVKTVANRGRGIEALKKAITDTAKQRKDISFKIDYDRDIESEIETLTELLKDKNPSKPYGLRWLVVKLLEGDAEELREVRSWSQGKEIEQRAWDSKNKLERHIGYDLETAMVERRYGFLDGLVRECSQKELGIKERLDLSDRIDSVVLNKVLGIPIFLALIWLTFQLVFTVGNPVADWVDALFAWFGRTVSSAIMAMNGPAWLSSLVSEGIIAGVGSVLVFLPNILLLFLVIAILEDSGYMARAAFVMDRFMHALGLHGKSFIPLLMGFGCNIPAIMATRTLESRKDRILTILVNPLMSCSARLPIYILFAGAFFAHHQGLVVFSLYFAGMVLAVLMARLFKTVFFREEVAPLIMELPPYRMPQLKGIVIHMWERARLFLRKAGTIIVAGVVVIWLLASLPIGVDYASQESLIGKIGSFFAPVLKPAGFGFWQAAVALIFGIMAKEVVVGTLGTLYGGEEGLRVALVHYFTPFSAYAFMLMCLIYIPCVSAIATIKRETNWRWTALAVGYSLLLGWIVSVLFYQISTIFV